MGAKYRNYYDTLPQLIYNTPQFKSEFILLVYSDLSNMPDPNGQSRAVGLFLLGPWHNKPHIPMLSHNVMVHIQLLSLYIVLVYATEVELRATWNHCQTAGSTITTLEENDQNQIPTPLATQNSTNICIIIDTQKQKQSWAIDMQIYLLRGWVKQDQFHDFWVKLFTKSLRLHNNSFITSK